MSDPFRYVGEKLLEPAGPDLWPLAILYFDPATKGLKVAIASVGAELIVGHGRKIGVILEAQARGMVKSQAGSEHRGAAPSASDTMRPIMGAPKEIDGHAPDNHPEYCDPDAFCHVKEDEPA